MAKLANVLNCDYSEVVMALYPHSIANALELIPYSLPTYRIASIGWTHTDDGRSKVVAALCKHPSLGISYAGDALSFPSFAIVSAILRMHWRKRVFPSDHVIDKTSVAS